MSVYEEMINKSLEEIDTLVDSIKKSHEVDEEEVLSKANPDISPDDISDDVVPEEDPETDDSEDSEEHDMEPGTDPDTDEDEDFEKSVESELGGNDNTRKALEISEFLQELVKSMDTVLTERTDRIHKSVKASSDESNLLLAKSVRGIALGQKAVLESNAELLKSFKSMGRRLQELESQPVVRKSVTNKAQVIEKSFDASLAQQEQPTLTKSQASAKLMQAYDSGNKEIMNDILALEGTGNFASLSDEGKSVLGLL